METDVEKAEIPLLTQFIHSGAKYATQTYRQGRQMFNTQRHYS